MKYYAIATKDGGMQMNEYSKGFFKNFLKENAGVRLQILPLLPESRNQRNFFEGAVIPLACYLHENFDHRNYKDLIKMRELLKVEFNGEFINFNGKKIKVGKTTKGKLNDGFIEKCIDYLEEQYGIDRTEVLNPENYKYWRDTIFPFGDINSPDNYIDYLVELKKLK